MMFKNKAQLFFPFKVFWPNKIREAMAPTSFVMIIKVKNQKPNEIVYVYFPSAHTSIPLTTIFCARQSRLAKTA